MVITMGLLVYDILFTVSRHHYLTLCDVKFDYLKVIFDT